jgi:predicted SAM-dependent methyltransferase
MRRFNRRPNAKCPRCGSLERHRTLWLYLCRETNVLSADLALLHFAPEPAIEAPLRASRNLRYTAADLEPARSNIVKADLTATPFADESFDVILCNHVLEHIVDDRAAISELYRMLKPGGRAIMQHPIDANRATTFEDASIVSPRDRLEAFGQSDHVRMYGRDFPDRLASVGFETEVHRYEETVGHAEASRYALREQGGLARGSDVCVAEKPLG